MRQPQAAVGLDRLPWLDDEPEPRTKRGRGMLWLLAAVAMLVIAAASYWTGMHSRQPPLGDAPRAARPSTTIRLPEPRPAQGEVKLDRMPDVAPVMAPTVRPAPQRQVVLRGPPTIVPAPVATSEQQPQPQPQPQPQLQPQPQVVAPTVQRPPALWPARQAAGAAGRLVRIGAFGSRLQAKRGWWAMARAYPAMRRLPAVVVESRNSRGRHFYRFQIGTSSQAHSEVLCQRMQAIRFSCAVVGLPWKPKGVER
jgi:hypothetical protein